MEASPRDEWRVEVTLDYSEHGNSLGERLGALDLDDEFRERLGRRVIVTRDGPKLFAYSRDPAAVREAKTLIEQILEEDSLDATIAVTRWHPIEEAWQDAELPLPQTPEQEEAEREANEVAEQAEVAETGEYDWQVAVEHVSFGEARELAERLREDGLDAEAHWRHVLVGALTEERAEELVERVRAIAPDDARIHIRANLDDVNAPTFFFFPGVAP
ncbi:hypothetical protein HJD18_00585 [Thermoleophilia bacterium SCSIO 60948]|nr:hypothetical protein HJD18_00585 [Thermoleophilia bacterium SCSIO 60948]